MAKHDKPRLVTGFFKHRAAAEKALDAIVRRGYDTQDVTVIMSDQTRAKQFAVETRTRAAEGAGVGGAVGGVVGATLAALAAVGTSIAVPGLGLVIAGPIAAALAGAGAGAATGGLIGLLVGTGIPEHRAKVYEAGLKEGGILLGVEARSAEDADELEHLLDAIGAEAVRQQ